MLENENENLNGYFIERAYTILHCTFIMYPRSTCACDGYFLNCQQQCGFICVPSVISVCIFSFALVFFLSHFLFWVLFYSLHMHSLRAKCFAFWLFPLHNFPHFLPCWMHQHNLLLHTFQNIFHSVSFFYACVCECVREQVQNAKIASMEKKTHRFYDYY